MMHERGTMTQMEFLQAMQMRVRMRAFQKMQETLVQVRGGTANSSTAALLTSLHRHHKRQYE